MGLPPKPNQLTDLTSGDPKFSEISVDRLIDDSLLALYREIKNILKLSAHGKLDPNDARDLRDHLKLLFELKEREKEALHGMTDEEIKAKAKAALDGDDK
jgi:hypothetical protein